MQWGRVVFSQAGPGDGEERVGERADGHVPVPGGPFANLVLVQPELIFAAPVVVLDVPSQPGRRDDRGQRGAGRDMSKEVGDLDDPVAVFLGELRLGGPADQQHVHEARRRRLVLDGHLVRGEVPVPFTFSRRARTSGVATHRRRWP